MITITGYKQVEFSIFTKALIAAFETSEKSYVQVAADINVKAVDTARNAFRCDRQIVSDEVLTNVMKSISLPGMVIWIYGKKYYYLKQK